MAKPTPIEETSAGGVIFAGARRRAAYLVIRDSYRNWGFPKGHVEDRRVGRGRRAARGARRRRASPTWCHRAPIQEIDWFFRFRGRLIHKTCTFFLMESAATARRRPQRGRGHHRLPLARRSTTRCETVSYANAREVLQRRGTTGAARSAPP